MRKLQQIKRWLKEALDYSARFHPPPNIRTYESLEEALEEVGASAKPVIMAGDMQLRMPTICLPVATKIFYALRGGNIDVIVQITTHMAVDATVREAWKEIRPASQEVQVAVACELGVKEVTLRKVVGYLTGDRSYYQQLHNPSAGRKIQPLLGALPELYFLQEARKLMNHGTSLEQRLRLSARIEQLEALVATYEQFVPIADKK